ncbi:MAG: CARDB domain-containing protein, partial [Thermoplasmata archaeon]
SLIHVGGERLRTSDIRIFVYVNNQIAHQSSATVKINTEYWTIGQRWNETITGVTIYSTVLVTVVDYVKNVVVFSKYLLGSSVNTPPVILRIGTYPDPVLIKNDFKVYAIVWDAENNLDKNSVYVNMSDVDASFASVNNGIYKLNYVGGNRFERSFGKMPEIYLPDNQGVIKNVTVNATDVDGLGNIPGTGNGTITIGRVSDVPDAVDLLIRQDPNYMPLDVRFSKTAPVQGDYIMIYVRVTNVGGTATNVSVAVYDNGVFIGNATDRFGATSQHINGNYDMRDFQLLWQVSSAGMHRIMASASVVGNYPWEKDDNLGNNNASADLGAMPRILLVDDDNNPSDGSYKDTAGYISAALDACGFPYDIYIVRQGQDGPKYSTGEPKLEDYGVVIWTTGYETANTLRANDIASLSSYLESNNRGLWLIGQDILNDVSANVSGGAQFILDKLHITGVDYDVGLPSVINGTDTHFLTSMMNFSTANRAGTVDKADRIVLDSDLGTRKMLEAYGNGDCFGMTYNNTESTRRLCFLPFEFSRIKSTDDITILTFKIVLWLGNLTRSFGVDLSVTSQEIDNTEPYYYESVKISFTIRNNSDINLTSVHYSIYLDYGTPDATILYDSIGKKMCDMVSIPRTLEKGGLPNASYSGEVGWVADRLGLHTITLFVDPSNELDEIDEDNNIAKPPFAVTRIFVRYNVLVVDDDGSENNGGSELNSTENITHSLDFLNYKYDFAVSSIDINSTYMQQYNLVIWSCGRTENALNKEELENITDYLTLHNGNVWLIGHGIVESLAPSGVLSDVAKDVFKLNNVVIDCQLTNTLYGDPDNFAHGARYRMNVSTTINDVDAMWYDTSENAFTVLADSMNRPFMYAYKNESDYSYNTVLSSFDLGLVLNRDDLHELVYLVMHYFKMPDERIELRVTSIDLYYTTQSIRPTPLYQMKPVLGNSYMLQATIWNVGGNRGDAVVRFVDGGNVINSGVVSVREDGSTVIEVIWTPAFAGSRTITAIIDPVNNIPVSYDPADTSGEILKSNNRASINLEVYYFYDDMEHGTLNWRHDTTLMNINGESPIEFIDDIGLVNTNVVSKWAEMHGWDEATRAYHSYNSSYLMYEGWGGGPVDVVIILDRSKSMGDGNYPSKLWDAKMAALAMVANLSDDSRVAVESAKGAGQPWLKTPFTLLTPEGRNTINTSIGEFTDQSVTLLWDTIGDAVNYCLNEPNPEGRPRAIVVLSDGCDRNGDDGAPYEWPMKNGDINTLEQASNAYCPWHKWTDPLKNYNSRFGKYNGVGQPYGGWLSLSPKNGNRRGLLNAPIPIFTVGLDLEHHFPPYYPSTNIKPVENQIETTYATYIHSDPNDAKYWESGTVEYNLWRISTTTGGRYFYAKESKDLGAIFDTIGRIISGGMQARGSREAPVHTNSSRAPIQKFIYID